VTAVAVIALASLLIISVVVHTRLRWGDDSSWDERDFERDLDERDEDERPI
jgi:hypothetical protein